VSLASRTRCRGLDAGRDRRKPRGAHQPACAHSGPLLGDRCESFTETLNGPGEKRTKLGQSIFTAYLLPFEMTGALLVIAVVKRPWSWYVAAPKAPPKPSERPLPGPLLSGKATDRDAGAMTVPGRGTVLAAVLFVSARPAARAGAHLVMYMCIELMLNSVNLTFVTFSRMLNDLAGRTRVLCARRRSC